MLTMRAKNPSRGRRLSAFPDDLETHFWGRSWFFAPFEVRQGCSAKRLTAAWNHPLLHPFAAITAAATLPLHNIKGFIELLIFSRRAIGHDENQPISAYLPPFLFGRDFLSSAASAALVSRSSHHHMDSDLPRTPPRCWMNVMLS